MSLFDQFMQSEQVDAALKKKIGAAIEILLQAFRKYGVENVAFSFNGGKDSVVVLHLLRAAISKFAPKSRTVEDEMQEILTVFWQSGDNFKEMDDFLEDTVHRYHLRCLNSQDTIKHGLEVLLEQHPHIKAIALGTRYSDPHSTNLTPFMMTDTKHGWPEVMRIHPILDWSFHDVWAFLRSFHLPYCVLYDRGYTSIGSKYDTVPNPALRIEENSYAPAYELKEESLERHGRL